MRYSAGVITAIVIRTMTLGTRRLDRQRRERQRTEGISGTNIRQRQNLALGYFRLVIRGSLVRFPWSACRSVLGQDTEPQTAPDVLVGTKTGEC